MYNGGILSWNHKTNEFEEIPVLTIIQEYEIELKHYRNIAKYAKKVHKKKKANSWANYLEGEIKNMKAYEEWYNGYYAKTSDTTETSSTSVRTED